MKLYRSGSYSRLKSYYHKFIKGNGLIDFNEFVTLMETRAQRVSEDAEMRAYFAAFDKDSNGYIDQKELKTTFSEIGMKISDKDVREMMKEAGVQIHGRIYYEDFVRMMTGKIGRAQKKVSRRMSGEATSPILPVDLEEEEDVETRELRVAFAMFDANGDGLITSTELTEVMRSLGMDTNTKKVQEMITKVDLDGNGSIDFDEFCRMMRRRDSLAFICRRDKHEEEAELRQAFKVFDRKEKGYIEGGDLAVTMKQLGVTLTDDDVKAMMHDAGVKEDGRIFYEDFVRIMFGKIIRPLPKLNETDDFTPEQIQDLKVAFALFDKDGDGAITVSELLSVMKSLGFKSDDAMVKKMIDRFDYDGNGTLEFEEFLRMMTSRNKKGQTRWESSREPRQEPEAWRAFKVFDRDRNGFISAVELKATMKELGVHITDEDAECMIKEADLDGDGKINYQEFTNMMEGKFQAVLGPNAQPPNTTMTTTSSPMTTTTADSSRKPAQPTTSSKSSKPPTIIEEPPITPVKNNTVKSAPSGGGFLNSLSLRRNSSKSPSPSSSRKSSLTNSSKSKSTKAMQSSSSASPHSPQQAQHANGTTRTVSEKRQANGSASSSVKHQASSFFSRLTHHGSTKGKSKGSTTGAQAEGHPKYHSGQPPLAPLPVNSLPKDLSWKPLDPKSPTDEEMMQVFAMFDQDRDGCIQASELGNILRLLGIPFSPDSLGTMIANADSKGNGTVDFHEFIRMMSRSRSRTKSDDIRKKVEEEEMRQAFKVFDIDGNGYIDANELRLTMNNLGENLSEEDVKAMIREADINGDGRIDYEEFIRMMYAK